MRAMESAVRAMRGRTASPAAGVVGALQKEAERSLVRSILSSFDLALSFLGGCIKFVVAPFILGAALSYVPDGLGYLNEAPDESVMFVQWTEAVSLSFFFSWLSLLQHRG